MFCRNYLTKQGIMGRLSLSPMMLITLTQLEGEEVFGSIQQRVVSPQKEGEIISGVEIPTVGYTDSIGIAGIFLKQKEGYYKSFFTSKSLQTSNFIILVYGFQGIRSLLISFQKTNWLLNQSGNSYFNNRNLTSAIPTSLHGSFHKLDRGLEQNR